MEKPLGSSRREYSSLLAALNELIRPDKDRPIILFQTRGDEALLLKPMNPFMAVQSSLCKGGHNDFCERSYSFVDVISAVELSRVTIYGIVPVPRIVGLSRDEQIRRTRKLLDIFSDEYHNRKGEKEREEFRRKWEDLTLRESEAMQKSVIDVTRAAGGFTTFLDSADRYVDIYSSIFKTIDNRYTIGYYSGSDGIPSGVREISITVKGRPDFVVLSRKTYTPDTRK